MVKSPYPSCQAKSESRGNLSEIHLEDSPLMRLAASLKASVGGKPSNRWTWSSTPPICTAFHPWVRQIPPRYCQTSFSISAVIHGVRFLVEKTRCAWSEVKVLAMPWLIAVPVSRRDTFSGAIFPWAEAHGYRP